MSVPPEMLARCTSALISRWTKSKLCAASGLPVDRIVRSAPRSKCAPGRTPSFSSTARYLALVPNTVTRSASAMRHSCAGSGASGAPSYSTSVAPTASPDTSQFHIIHPQVVK